jgi:hypothetical protein
MTLPEDTVIEIGKSIPLSAYRGFFDPASAGGKYSLDFQNWLNRQVGKTLKEALPEYGKPLLPKPLEDLLAERRFGFIADGDKAFMIAFDQGIGQLGYDCGGAIVAGNVWGKMQAVYAKTGVKAKKIAARVYIREDHILLRLYFTDIDKHRAYAENAPEHIKAPFLPGPGDCRHCYETCRHRKRYTLAGESIEKCDGVVFEFHRPALRNLPDYLALLNEFYPAKIKTRGGAA